MSYVEQVIKATGGHAAPAEVLREDDDSYADFISEFDDEDLQYLAEVGEDYEDLEDEDADRPPAPPGYHYMPDGTLMRDDEHSTREALSAAGYLVPEEQDLADALLEIVEKHGKFNADNTGVWAGYTTAAENDNKEMGVKCGNCVFWEAPNGCKLIIAETEEGGLCRFAVLPDGAVNPKDKPVEDYFSKSPRLIQEELKKKIKEMENQYKEDYVEISDLTPTQETVDTENFKEAESFEKPVIVYKDDEGMKLVDGHHRCATRIKDGHRGIKAKVYQGPIVATAGSKPAAPSERIKGSKKNPKGSASGGKKITFSKKVETALKNKVEKHNEKHGDTASKKTSLRTLKAVYRRGAGAFSTSHRPDQNRNSWAMARVNAFLHLLRTGSPKNKKYTTDNDLLPAAHKRSSKKSAAITAAADPCWDGYKQVGMKKGRDGEMVPNCIPVKAAQSLEKIQSILSSDEVEEVLAHYNSNVGASRQVALSAAALVAERSYDAYYESTPTEELANAILWELHSFMEYAVYGTSTDVEVVSEHDDLLASGHPSRGMTASVESRINWISGAPELDESGREAVRFALSDSASPLEAIHASSRIKALAASGKMSESTLALVNGLIDN